MIFPFITESEYPKAVEERIKPFLKSVEHKEIRSKDGTRLSCYQALHEDPIGSVTMVHGFCEFFGKYHELAYLFHEAGYSVFFVELRGHGLSEKRVLMKDHVYVDSFEEYVEDLDAVVTQLTSICSCKERILFAHSMGGAVATLYLEEHPGFFTKAILSSPMLEIDYRGTPDWKVKLLVHASRKAHIDTPLVPGVKGWTGTNEFEKSSCLSRNRYMYQFNQRRSDPDYQTWSSTYAWTRAARDGVDKAMKNAKNIQIPVLLFQAGRDTMVKPGGQQKFCETVEHAQLIRCPLSKHEIFNADDDTRRTYFEEISSFLNK